MGARGEGDLHLLFYICILKLLLENFAVFGVDFITVLQTFTMITFLSLKCLTIFFFMELFFACAYDGGGGLNFCHFGACILLTDPFRLVVFTLNEAGLVIWTFFSREHPVLFLWSKNFFFYINEY